jgi:hypothetical protein
VMRTTWRTFWGTWNTEFWKTLSITTNLVYIKFYLCFFSIFLIITTKNKLTCHDFIE